jgi:hypothetical protein
MTMRLMTARWKIVAALVVLIGSGATGVAMVDTRPEAVRAREWARIHADSLPPAAVLAGYPLAFRRAAFGVMSPAAKAEMAREYLSAYLSRPALTQEQRAFIKEVLELLAPSIYERSNLATNKERFGWVCERLGMLFPNQADRARLASFGEVGAAPIPWRAWAGSIQRTMGLGIAHANSSAALDECDCIEFTYCSLCSGLGGVCKPGLHTDPMTCIVYPWSEGCGCFFFFVCDGVCDLTPAR